DGSAETVFQAPVAGAGGRVRIGPAAGVKRSETSQRLTTPGGPVSGSGGAFEKSKSTTPGRRTTFEKLARASGSPSSISNESISNAPALGSRRRRETTSCGCAVPFTNTAARSPESTIRTGNQRSRGNAAFAVKPGPWKSCQPPTPCQAGTYWIASGSSDL